MCHLHDDADDDDDPEAGEGPGLELPEGAGPPPPQTSVTGQSGFLKNSLQQSSAVVLNILSFNPGFVTHCFGYSSSLEQPLPL
mmetsp:Transcript_27015/g.64878  ORF Transcript_27015/g.64878 Transcript_27015/m.64878 type:complete len:83 (-) Transcript_27015:280-528(-)